MTADRPAPRGGFTLIEAAITAFLLAAAMSLVVQVVGWVAAERRASDRRQCASQEVANLMERIAARPWDRLATDALKDVALSAPARRTLPDADLSVAVVEAEGPPARQVRLQLRWRNRAGTWEAPVRLSAWFYRRANPR